MNAKSLTNTRVPKGFTLLEILLALFIFSVAISVIFGAYTGTLKVKEDTEFQTDSYQMARIAMERMREDLESACISEFVGQDEEINGMNADTLNFKSRAHLALDEGDKGTGTSQIGYYAAEADEEGSLVLYRSDTPELEELPEAGTGGLEMCAGLSSVNFTYYDESGEAYDSWDSTDKKSEEKLPKMVTIRLEFVNKSNPEEPLKFMVSVAIPMATKT